MFNERNLPSGFHVLKIRKPKDEKRELAALKGWLNKKKREMKMYEIKIQCCVCKEWLGTKPTSRPDQHGEVSHTYCDKCLELTMKELE